jgi:type I restriction enzyme, S subunit
MESAVAEIGVQKYEAYKPIEETWIGEVPAHWHVIKSKLLWKEVVDLSNDSSECLLSVSQYSGVKPTVEDSRSESFIGYKKVREGDLVINIMLAWMGGLGIANYNGIVSPAYAVYRSTSNIDIRYFHFLYRTSTYLAEFARRSRGVVPSRWRMYTDDFGQVLSLLPPLQEQNAIANFLDHKTAQIDQAIAQKERLIERLQERRQILIQRAVTRGLNPDVPMKDSGVEWIGEIPAHWEVVRSKALFQERKEKARKDDKQLTASQKYGMISQEEFMEREGRRVTVVLLNRDILKHIEANDFVISMRSFQGGLEHSELSGCVSSAYIPLVPIKHIVPAYFKYLFKSDGYIKAISSTSNLVRDGQAMRFENFAAVPLLIIPEVEQENIAYFLDKQLIKQKKATDRLEKQIEQLREYKSTLINAAVTGKIMVC